MARVKTVGIEGIRKRVNMLSITTRMAAVRVVEKAGDTAADELRIELDMQGIRDTGKLAKSIKRGPVIVSSDSAKTEVWPHGSRKRSQTRVKNAIIGNVQHYGRSYGKKKRPATNFFSLPTQGTGEIHETLRKEWEEEVGKLNG